MDEDELRSPDVTKHEIEKTIKFQINA